MWMLETGEMKPRILVVDDDAENCRALSELLTVEGFDPVAFESAEAAWSAMAREETRPTIVVADVRMPGLNGVALLKRIKARFPAVPVILVSAFPDEQVWSEGLRSGAVDVFPKPIHGASLVRTLRETVSGSQTLGLPIGENPDPQRPGGHNNEEGPMKKIAALVLVATFVFAGIAMAGELEGKIRSIDTASMVIVLDDGTKLVCDDSTNIMVEGNDAKLEDLKEGAKVKANYEEKDGKNVAAMLEVSE
jgi:two-component system response regulator CpxR